MVRQLRYSLHNENSIDLVLFLNGLPVATVELKTNFTQSIGDAIDQYRFDRTPRPKGQAAEPLLSFPHGALVHFAVSNSEVAMATRLDGPATVFLPFNQGNDGGAGNPVNAGGGHRTAYLWEQVWTRESWLKIIGRYLIAQRNEKKQIKAIIFLRCHQLAFNNTKQQFANSPDLMTKLQNAVMESYDAHTSMSTQALNSPVVLRGMLDILLNHSHLYETLRARPAPYPTRQSGMDP